jgi:thymidylate synthase ThyX
VTEKKTPEEWAALDGVTVADPDGWRFAQQFGNPPRLRQPQGWDVPITRQEWDDRVGVSSCIRRPAKTKEVQKWADTAMFASAPLDASIGPEVSVLSFSPDPLGEIASAVLMYQGKPVKDLADITDEERRKAFAQVQATKLKAPFEFVKMHLLFSGVTRSWTHQLVRQRTAAYAQESLRFAFVEDGFTSRVALPPSLAGTTAEFTALEQEYTKRYAQAAIDRDFDRLDAAGEWFEQQVDRLSQGERWRFKWDMALRHMENAYTELVNDGMPAEDARGLLPHNITTRVHYTTDLRALQDHAGNRLCTQAQFEWRTVFIKLVKALREYGKGQKYRVRQGVTASDVVNTKLANGYQVAEVSSAWQFDLIADLFRPVCYLTGKCEFAAQDLDRKCSIRGRVDANHQFGRASSEWHLPLLVANDGWNSAEVAPIDPAEWLTRPDAAR